MKKSQDYDLWLRISRSKIGTIDYTGTLVEHDARLSNELVDWSKEYLPIMQIFLMFRTLIPDLMIR